MLFYSTGNKVACSSCRDQCHAKLYMNVFFLQHGRVPLMAAAENGHTEIVQVLWEFGANVNQQEKVS